MSPTQAEKATAFRALHAGEPFVIPNPWDAGSARVLEALGFRALATTSAGFAFSLGRLDGGVDLEELCSHVHLLASVTAVPLSVDVENGFGPEPDQAARAIALVAEAGAVGGSIEDYDPEGHLYCLEHAAARISAAARVAEGLEYPFTLTARAENHIRGNPDLADTIERLQAYEAAGADVLFAPGLRRTEDIEAICTAVQKPVNILALPGMTVPEIIEAGAQRISAGGGLTWAAVSGLFEASIELRDRGRTGSLVPPEDLFDWLRESASAAP